MYVKVNGTRLFFDVVGSSLQPAGQEMKPKPIVIALHGSPGFDHSSLRPNLDSLGEVAQVIYFDQRGHGRSARHSNEYYQLGIMADDIAAFCAELGIEKPVVLGWSFGGWVALTIAVRHPDLLGGLILYSVSPRGADNLDLDLLEQLAGKELREVAARDAVGQASEEDKRRFGEELLPLYLYPPKPELLATAFSRTILNEEIGEYMEERLRNEYDVRPQLAGIVVPTLVLHGRYDWVLSIREAVENFKSKPFANPEAMDFWSMHTLDPMTTIQQRPYPYDEYKLFFVPQPRPKDAWKTVIWESRQPYSFVHHNCCDMAYEILCAYGCPELLDPAKEFVPNDWYDALPGRSYAIAASPAIPIRLHKQSRHQIATREIALVIPSHLKGSTPPWRKPRWRAWEELTLVWEMMIGHVRTACTSGIELIAQRLRGGASHP